MDRLSQSMSPEQVAMTRQLIATYGWDADEALFAVALAAGATNGDVVIVDPSGEEHPAPVEEPVAAGARASENPSGV